MKQNFRFDTTSSIIKICVIISLSLIMLIPVKMLESLIADRETTQHDIQKEIGDMRGGSQTLTGPILVLPYWIDHNTVDYAYFLPDSYTVEGVMNPEEHLRNIYHALTYQTKLQIKGNFSNLDYQTLNIRKEQIKWEDAFLIIGVSTIKGISDKISLNVNGKLLDVQPEINKNEILETGLTVKMPINPEESLHAYNFEFDMILYGSENLSITPIGKENFIHLTSLWNTAAFTGNTLPTESKVGEEGFDVRWNIFDYNGIYTQMWTGKNDMLKLSALGVDVAYPIDQYQMSMRSVKYAIMFVAFTFFVFFLIELISRKRIHPVQYLLVSFALIIFYSLLLALSEHINFQVSYLVSALATIILITAYSKTIFKSNKLTVLMGGFLSILYIYLYIILQMETMSLLVGSIGLFVALAIVMYVSRNINWYRKSDEIDSDDDTFFTVTTPPHVTSPDSEIVTESRVEEVQNNQPIVTPPPFNKDSDN